MGSNFLSRNEMGTLLLSFAAHFPKGGHEVIPGIASVNLLRPRNLRDGDFG